MSDATLAHLGLSRGSQDPEGQRAPVAPLVRFPVQDSVTIREHTEPKITLGLLDLVLETGAQPLPATSVKRQLAPYEQADPSCCR